LNPTNCDQATVTVTVNAAVIDAVNDDFSATPINGSAGGTTATVLTNDTLNGVAVSLATVTLTPGASPNAGLTMNASGTITVAAGTAAGTYVYPYTICEQLNPTNCDTANATVVVTAAPIVANDNDASATPVNGATGGTAVANVLVDDTLNGGPATTANVTISVITPATNPGVVLNPATGAVTVAPNTAAGTYTIVYQICEQLNPT
ncbi:hypothetical protein, partial [Arenimonas oryziterrae]|uniref:hypothetical protein n=1 Tax=Arenimonas oryziterrae TaxID=498055 RepID=UPI00054FE9E5